MKIGLFVPCYVDALYPEVGVATLRLLRSLGLDVDYPERQTCCGQPMGNAGFESQAVPLWQEVLRLDENNELANSGIGKAYLSAGDNERALTYLRRGMNRAYYSVAFKRWRNEMLAGNISWILTLVVVLVILLMVWKRVLKPRLAAARTAKGGRTA